MKRAVRTVYTLFYFSVAASIWASIAYMIFPIESGALIDIRYNNLFIGLGIAFALLAIGIGTIHWGKSVMSDKEYIEDRHATRGRDQVREGAINVFAEADKDSGFGRREIIRNSMFAALAASVIPGITLFRGLAPQDVDPVTALSHTMWKEGMRLSHDPSGRRSAPPTSPLGSAFHVIPRSSRLGHDEGYLEEKAKAIVLLMRMQPEQLNPETNNWTGRTTASSRTPRSARTSAAPWRCTSSRPTTSCALPPVAVRRRQRCGRHLRPAAVPCRSSPSPSTPRATSSLRVTSRAVGPSFWERS